MWSLLLLLLVVTEEDLVWDKQCLAASQVLRDLVLLHLCFRGLGLSIESSRAVVNFLEICPVRYLIESSRLVCISVRLCNCQSKVFQHSRTSLEIQDLANGDSIPFWCVNLETGVGGQLHVPGGSALVLWLPAVGIRKGGILTRQTDVGHVCVSAACMFGWSMYLYLYTYTQMYTAIHGQGGFTNIVPQQWLVSALTWLRLCGWQFFPALWDRLRICVLVLCAGDFEVKLLLQEAGCCSVTHLRYNYHHWFVYSHYRI